MTDHKQPQRRRGKKFAFDEISAGVFQVLPGLYKKTALSAATVVDGAEVHAEIAWVDGKPVIEKLTIERATAETITTGILRSISLPALLADAVGDVGLYIDEQCTVPVDDNQWPAESLEEWAARLYMIAVVTNRSPAEYIADKQNITLSTANQRIVIIRKMKLIDPIIKKEKP